MRALWTVLSVLAVSNLLAIGGLVGWLAWSDRLDEPRVQRVRGLFAETLTAERARVAAARAGEEARARDEAQRLKDQTDPVRSQDVLRLKLDASAADQERLERWRRESEDLQSLLRANLDELERERAAFRKERDAFDTRRRRIEELEGSDYFRKTLATYESLKPAAAAGMLTELLRPAGAPSIDGAGAEQVVAYLNAMDDRARTRIIAEFEKADPALAADLLERLRTRAVAAAGPEGADG